MRALLFRAREVNQRAQICIFASSQVDRVVNRRRLLDQQLFGQP
jgi:hypothetical protein